MSPRVENLTSKAVKDKTQSTRTPEQSKSETLLEDHPNGVAMFRCNVFFLPLVLWCSVFYRCVEDSNGVAPFAGFFDQLKQFGAGVLRSDAGTNFFFSTV